MAPKRSDDPEARAVEEEAPKASDYWDESRRHAARPAGIRLDPKRSSTGPDGRAPSCDPPDESSATTSGDGDTAPERRGD